MANYKYYTIFFNIDSEEYTEQEKLHAIKNVLGMATYNGVNKQSIINAFRWMYNFAFEEAAKPQTFNDRINAMSPEEKAEWLYNHDSITAEKGRLSKEELLELLKSEDWSDLK